MKSIPENSALHNNYRGLKILVVDQDNLHQLNLSEYLPDEFSSVQMYDCTPETDNVLAALREYPDVIVISIANEELVVGTVSIIKSAGNVEGLPVIAVIHTPLTSSVKQSLYNAGAGYLLQYPLDPVDAKMAFRNALCFAHQKMMNATSGITGDEYNDLNSRLIDQLKGQQAVEKKLKESESRFRTVFDATNVGELIYTIDGKSTVNNAFAGMLGFSKEELRNVKWIELIHPDDFDQMREVISEIKTSPSGTARLDIRFIKKDGSILWADINVALLKDDQNRTDYYHSTIVDITEIKKAQEILQKSEEEYRTTVEGLLVGVIVHDRTTKILLSNPEASRLLGLSQAQLMGREAMDPNWHFVGSDGTPLPIEEYPVMKVLKSGLPLMNYIVGAYTPSVDAVTWANVNAVPVFDSQGEIDKVIVNFEDITERIKAENSLKDNIEFTNSLLKTIPFGLSIVDEDGNIMFSSDNLAGLTENGTLTGRCWEILKDDKTQCINCPLHRRIVVGETSVIETDKILDGKSFQITHTGMMFNGKKAILEIFQDITEKKKIEKQVRLLAHSMESISECVSITDTDNFLLYVNESFTRTYGYTKEELIGKHISVLRMGGGAVGEPDIIAETFNGGWRGELMNKRKDGTLFPILLSTSVVTNEDNEPLALIGVAIDITEIKQAREELIAAKEKAQRNEEHIRRYFEQNLIGMAITSPEKGWIEVNSAVCEYLGYSREELNSKNWVELTHPDDLNADLQLFNETVEGKRDGYKIDKRFIHKDGSIVYTELGVRVMRRPDGSAEYFLALINDISLRKHIEFELMKAKDKAEEMNRIKSSFFANMSHELRTPLIGVLGFAELLAAELENRDELASMAKRISKSGNRLLRTLNLILDLSKLEAMQSPPELMSLNIVPELEEITGLFGPAVQSKGLSYLFNSYVPEIYCKINRVFFHSIFNNLINNALRFTSGGGINITAEIQENNAVITVRDTGEGIPPEKHDIIWHEFRQASEGYSRSHEGTGLGLTLAKRYCELMGGGIRMESIYGEGTTFYVVFPLSLPQQNETEPHAESLPEVPHTELLTGEYFSKKHNVLYVEDDELAVMIVKMIVKDMLNLDVAVNAKEALARVKEEKYDCLLMDINLRKGMDGLQATELIRRMPEYRDTPIVAVTAYAMESEKIEFLTKGFSHYIPKPFTRNELLTQLQQILH